MILLAVTKTRLVAAYRDVFRYTKYVVIALAVITVPVHFLVHDAALLIALLYAAQTVLSELEA